VGQLDEVDAADRDVVRALLTTDGAAEEHHAVEPVPHLACEEQKGAVDRVGRDAEAFCRLSDLVDGIDVDPEATAQEELTAA
jgi:hypothetical protein